MFHCNLLYLQPFSRYRALNILGSRPWPFKVTWRHWSCDHFGAPYSISNRCSIVTDSLSAAVFEILGRKHIGVTTLTFQGQVTWRHRSRDHSIPRVRFPIGASLEPSPYVQAFSRYLALNISGSRPWPFGVMWLHRECDHLIPPYSISYRCSIVTYSISSRFRDIGP